MEDEIKVYEIPLSEDDVTILIDSLIHEIVNTYQAFVLFEQNRYLTPLDYVYDFPYRFETFHRINNVIGKETNRRLLYFSLNKIYSDIVKGKLKASNE